MGELRVIGSDPSVSGFVLAMCFAFLVVARSEIAIRYWNEITFTNTRIEDMMVTWMPMNV